MRRLIASAGCCATKPRREGRCSTSVATIAWYVLLLLGSLLGVPGCAFGREVAPPRPLAPVVMREAGAKRTIHVARLSEYEYNTSSTTSQTGSTEVTTIMEAATMKDVSGEVAEAIKANGVQAMAHAGAWQGEGMAPNDLWVRGNVRWSNCLDCTARQVPAALIMIPTICIIGAILPYPFPVEYGVSADTRLEVINARGEILSTNSDAMTFSYGTIYVYPLVGNPDTAFERPELIAALGSAIAHLGG